MKDQGRGTHPTPAQRLAIDIVVRWAHGMDPRFVPPMEDLERLKAAIAERLSRRQVVVEMEQVA